MTQQPPRGPRSPHYRSFMITLRHTTLGRYPLDEWSARRRDLYLTTHNTHNRQTSTPPAEFEPKFPASEWPQTHAFDGAATVRHLYVMWRIYCSFYTPVARLKILTPVLFRQIGSPKSEYCSKHSAVCTKSNSTGFSESNLHSAKPTAASDLDSGLDNQDVLLLRN